MTSGLTHEIAVIQTWSGENKSEAFLKINPRGQVPVLETHDGVLTESTAILPYIADLAPAKALMPIAGTFERAKAQSWLSFLSSTLHTASSRLMFLPATAGDAERSEATARLVAAFHVVDRHLQGRDHLLDNFSCCDFYLLVFALWRAAPTTQGCLPTFANIDRFQKNTLARTGVMEVVGQEMAVRMKAMAENKTSN